MLQNGGGVLPGEGACHSQREGWKGWVQLHQSWYFSG